jgi:hypothetical protein
VATAAAPAPAPLADVNLILDDGTRENALGLTNGGQFIWLNRFTPDPADFPFSLTEVQILFGQGVGVNVGELVDIYIYEDTDGDGNPGTGANFLGSILDAQVQAVDDVNLLRLPGSGTDCLEWSWRCLDRCGKPYGWCGSWHLPGVNG